MKIIERRKKVLSVLLAFSMMLSLAPLPAHAAAGDGLCTHHETHTSECGYAPAVAGAACNHTHDDICGYAEPVTEVKCTCETIDESGALIHTEGCGYVAAAAGVPCAHTHDTAVCGYVKAVSGADCTYRCHICHVQQLVNALPEKVTAENAEAVAAQLTAIDNEKVSLSDDEMAQVDFGKYSAAISAINILAGQPGAEVPAAVFKLFVTVECRVIKIEAESSDTIEAVKDKLAQNGVTLVNPVLTYNEKVLEDGRTLSDFGITDGKSITVINHYNVTIGETTGGTVTADKDTAAMNDTVTLTVTPDEGFVLDTLEVKQSETALKVTNNQFTMPSGNVTVTVAFKAAANTDTPECTHSGDNIKYTASGNTITKNCPSCGEVAEIVLTASSGVYNGAQQQLVSVTQDPEGTFSDLPEVVYETDCFSAGEHTATLTYEGVTATVTFTIGKATPSYSPPTGLTAAYGDTLADVTLPEGFAWEEDVTTTMEKVGSNSFTVKYTPDDTDNNVVVTGIPVTVTVGKIIPTVTIPTGITAFYGQRLNQVTLNNPAGNIPGTWTWQNANLSEFTTLGEHTFEAVFTPTDTKQYSTVIRKLTLTVNPQPLTVMPAVVSKPYDGTTDATVTLSFDGMVGSETLIQGTDYTVTAAFADANAGENKTVAVNVRLLDTDAAKNYTLTNATVTATADIYKVNSICTAPVAAGNLTYNGRSQNLVTSGTATGGTMRYSLDGDTWSASIPTGKNAGTYTVYYKVVGDANHNDIAPQSFTVTIAKGTASVLTIPAQKHFFTYATENAVALNRYLPADRGETTYTLGSVTGNFFQAGTAVSGVGSLSYSTKAMTVAAEGSIEITVVMENYADVTLTVPVNLVALTAQSEDRIVQYNLTQVPAGLANTAFNTVEKIETEQNRVLVQALGGKTMDGVAHYDVKLQFSPDGVNWVNATADNFPAEGITITLPYPTGTGQYSHNFAVAHMFTVDSDRLDTEAGDVETPTVIKTSAGIQVTLKGLSPVSIAWSAIEFDVTVASATNGTVTADVSKATYGTEVTITVTPKSGYKLGSLTVKNASGTSYRVGAGSDGKYGFAMPASDVTVTATFVRKSLWDSTNPQTGDDFKPVLWSGLILTSLLGIVVLVLNKKKFWWK